MKKIAKIILTVLFVALLVTSIVACGKTDKDDNGNNGGNQTTPGDPDTPSEPDEPGEPSTHEHSYGEGKIVKDPDCVTAGEKEFTCLICGQKKTESIPALGHDEVQHEAKAATCTEKGNKAYVTCTRCDYTTFEEIKELGHEYNDKCACIRCGATNHMPNINCICDKCGEEAHGTREGNYCRHDEVIYFGSYPQTEVKDETLSAKLTATAGSLPTKSDKNGWTSYNYYIEWEKGDLMLYKDIVCDGIKYRGVFLLEYRPSNIAACNEYTPEQQENGYELRTVYWFKFEPIRWHVLNSTENQAGLLADLVIDSQEYAMANSHGVASNNYAESSIREWLNDTFYNTAFNESQQQAIMNDRVDNSAQSTGYADNTNFCADTTDKVCLMSRENERHMLNDDERMKECTDYAKIQGVAVCEKEGRSYGFWWLRSPGYNNEKVAIINPWFVGQLEENLASWTSYGVVPMIGLNL